MTDKYPLENVLTLTKSLITLYLNAVVESSNKLVRKLMEEGLTEMLKIQDELYKQMQKDNYYNVANVSAATVDKTLMSLTKDAS